MPGIEELRALAISEPFAKGRVTSRKIAGEATEGSPIDWWALCIITSPLVDSSVICSLVSTFSGEDKAMEQINPSPESGRERSDHVAFRYALMTHSVHRGYEACFWKRSPGEMFLSIGQ